MAIATIETKIEHRGPVRGASNAHARLHLCIMCPDIENASASIDEMNALFAPWDEEFDLSGGNWIGRDYRLNTRREFALIPLILRKAARCGYDVAVSLHDVGPRETVYLSKQPEVFWREVALAQMWFEKSERKAD